jgi:hypothetical protein
MKQSLSFLGFLAILAAGPAASGRDFNLSIGVSSQQFFTGEVDPVMKDRRTTGVSVRLGAEVWNHLLVEAEWVRTREKADLFVVNHTDMITDWITLGARFRVPVFSWLEPYARAGGGLTTGRLDLWAYKVPKVGDRAYSPHFCGALGLEVLFPRGFIAGGAFHGLTVGASVEVGYLHTLGLRYRLGTRAGRQPALASGGLDLGTLTLSGMTTRGGLWVHF